jgi:hypothetical protein
MHDLVSFDDPDERRTWVFDASFLLSPWSCIYGHGCQGVLTGPAPEREEGCCTYGAHLFDGDDEKRVLAAAERLGDDQWQFRRLAARRGGPIKDGGGRHEAMTRLVDGACIFLNRPGFPGGAGCALHRGALEAGDRPLDWKPDVCWQLPLRLVDATDVDGRRTTTLREWKRRDWGEGGADFHWWCTEAPEAFTGRVPVYEALRDEIVALVGEWPYERFVEHVSARGTANYLPHPVLRRAQTAGDAVGGRERGGRR